MHHDTTRSKPEPCWGEDYCRAGGVYPLAWKIRLDGFIEQLVILSVNGHDRQLVLCGVEASRLD